MPDDHHPQSPAPDSEPDQRRCEQAPSQLRDFGLLIGALALARPATAFRTSPSVGG
jgi:hypothetical protein